MPALVTGITGFAGSHLAEYLFERKVKFCGTCHSKNLHNLSGLNNNVLRLVRCDLTDFRQVFQVLKKLRPNQIYHLAGFSSVGKSFGKVEEVHQANFISTLNILESSRLLKIKPRILMVGSGDMYGRVSKSIQPIKESEALNPLSPYATSKALCDALAVQYTRHYGIPTIRVRAFNHIGPRQSLGFVIPDFCHQIARINLRLQNPVMAVGNLAVERDFLDVRDVVRGYYSLMEKGKAGEMYNIASGRAHSLRQILDLLLRTSPRTVKVISSRSRIRSIDIPLLAGDAGKIRRHVGWKPEIDLGTSLRDTCIYWLERVSLSKT